MCTVYTSLLLLLFITATTALRCFMAPPPFGNDANSGLTTADPFATLFRCSQEGCTRVDIAPGMYSGVNNTNIAFSNEVKLLATGNTVTFDLGSSTSLVRATEIIVEGLTIINGMRTDITARGILHSTAGNLIIRNSKLLYYSLEINFGTGNIFGIASLLRVPSSPPNNITIVNTVLSGFTLSFENGGFVDLRGIVANGQTRLDMINCTVSNTSFSYIATSTIIDLTLIGVLFEVDTGLIKDCVFIDYMPNIIVVIGSPLFIGGNIMSNSPKIIPNVFKSPDFVVTGCKFLNILDSAITFAASIFMLNNVWTEGVIAPNPATINITDCVFSSGITRGLFLQQSDVTVLDMGNTIIVENSLAIGGRNRFCNLTGGDEISALFTGGGTSNILVRTSRANFTMGNSTFQCNRDFPFGNTVGGDGDSCFGCEIIVVENDDSDTVCSICDCDDTDASIQYETVCGSCISEQELSSNPNISMYDVCDRCGFTGPNNCPPGSATVTPSATATASPTATASATPTVTPSPSITPTATPSPSPTPTPEPPSCVYQLQKSVSEADFFIAEFGSSISICGPVAVVGALNDITITLSKGSAYVFNRNRGGKNNWGLVQKLIPPASDEAIVDFFGNAVATFDNVTAVGAFATDLTVNSEGAVYVFEKLNDGSQNFIFKQRLSANNSAGALFGSSVAVSRNYIVVGALSEDLPGELNAGAAYVFERNLFGNWSLTQTLTAPDADLGDNFGNSLSLDEEAGWLLIGASGGNKAYMFTLLSGNWSFLVQLTREGQGGDGLTFGTTVVVANGTAIVCAPFESHTLTEQGSAYFYDQNENGIGVWGLSTFFSGDAMNDNLCTSAALTADGNVASISRVGEIEVRTRNKNGIKNWDIDSEISLSDVESLAMEANVLSAGRPTVASGNARFFGTNISDCISEPRCAIPSVTPSITPTATATATTTATVTTTPTLTASITPTPTPLSTPVCNFIEQQLLQPDPVEDDGFGVSISLCGDRAVVGEPNFVNGSGLEIGSAWVFQKSELWQTVTHLTAPDAEDLALFGLSTSIFNNVLAVGSPGKTVTGSSSAGTVYVYQFTANMIALAAELTSTNIQPSGRFGECVAAGNKYVLVCAPLEIVNGTRGRCYVFYKDMGGLNAWGFLQTLDIDDAQSVSRYASACSMDETTGFLVVSVEHEAFIGAYLYKFNGSHWNFFQSLIIPEIFITPDIAAATICNGTVALGLPSAGLSIGNRPGFVAIFEESNNGTWLFNQFLQGAQDLEAFGRSVDLSGSGVLAVSSPGTTTGRVRVFVRGVGGANNWGPGDLTIVGSAAAASENFGISVSIDNITLLVAQRTAEPEDAGLVYVYTTSNASCIADSKCNVSMLLPTSTPPVTSTPIVTATAAVTACPTPTPSMTSTQTITATAAVTACPTPTTSMTSTSTMTATAAVTACPTPTPTATTTVTFTSSSTATSTPTLSSTSTATPAVSGTKTTTSTVSPTPQPTPICPGDGQCKAGFFDTVCMNCSFVNLPDGTACTAMPDGICVLGHCLNQTALDAKLKLDEVDISYAQSTMSVFGGYLGDGSFLNTDICPPSQLNVTELFIPELQNVSCLTALGANRTLEEWFLIAEFFTNASHILFTRSLDFATSLDAACCAEAMYVAIRELCSPEQLWDIQGSLVIRNANYLGFNYYSFEDCHPDHDLNDLVLRIRTATFINNIVNGEITETSTVRSTAVHGYPKARGAGFMHQFVLSLSGQLDNANGTIEDRPPVLTECDSKFEQTMKPATINTTNYLASGPIFLSLFRHILFPDRPLTAASKECEFITDVAAPQSPPLTLPSFCTNNSVGNDSLYIPNDYQTLPNLGGSMFTNTFNGSDMVQPTYLFSSLLQYSNSSTLPLNFTLLSGTFLRFYLRNTDCNTSIDLIDIDPCFLDETFRPWGIVIETPNLWRWPLEGIPVELGNNTGQCVGGDNGGLECMPGPLNCPHGFCLLSQQECRESTNTGDFCNTTSECPFGFQCFDEMGAYPLFDEHYECFKKFGRCCNVANDWFDHPLHGDCRYVWCLCDPPFEPLLPSATITPSPTPLMLLNEQGFHIQGYCKLIGQPCDSSLECCAPMTCQFGVCV